jgi:uncharacterized membrane protein
MSYNINSGYGMLQAIALYSKNPTFGKVIVVMPVSDPSYNRVAEMFKHQDPDGELRLFNTLEEAYAEADTNRNDVILLSGHTTHSVAAGIAWSKNRIHVVGVDADGGRLVQQGSKVELSGNVASAYVIKVTGVRNSFKNIKFIQSSTNAAAVNTLQLAGEGTYMENVSAIFGVATNLGSTSASEVLLGEDSGTFVKCSFGTDVLTKTAASAVILLDAITGGNADGAKSNRFIDCETVVMSSSANALGIKLADTAGAKFLNEFVNQKVIAVINATNSAIAITNGIASSAGFVEGTLAFINPSFINCTNGCAGVTDKVVFVGPAVSQQAGEGVTPA